MNLLCRFSLESSQLDHTSTVRLDGLFLELCIFPLAQPSLSSLALPCFTMIFFEELLSLFIVQFSCILKLYCAITAQSVCTIFSPSKYSTLYWYTCNFNAHLSILDVGFFASAKCSSALWSVLKTNSFPSRYLRKCSVAFTTAKVPYQWHNNSSVHC